MKKIFTLLMLCTGMSSFAQQLQFSEVGSDPAYCRLFGYQSGNGVVWAAATGGTPDYTYLWTNLTTGATTINTVWGGLNPGDYEIKVWDNVGDSISQIVTVDSLNPIAGIGVVPGTVIGTHPNYTGTAPATVEFINESQNFINLWNPNGDTTFFWRMTQFESWVLSTDYFYQPQYTYNYNGDWAIDLVAVNKNGCTDTATVYLQLLGPSGLDESENDKITIISNPGNDQLVITNEGDEFNQLIKIYDYSGRLILTQQLNSSYSSIPFTESGIFIYELIDVDNMRLLKSGKLQF